LKGWNYVLHKAPRFGRLTFSKTPPLFWRSEMMRQKLQQTIHSPRLEPQYQVTPKTMEQALLFNSIGLPYSTFNARA
jgi:hypothetical protein